VNANVGFGNRAGAGSPPACGRHGKAGQTAAARSRLVIAESPTERQILRLYKEYMNGAESLLHKSPAPPLVAEGASYEPT